MNLDESSLSYRLSIAYIIRVIKVRANNPLTLNFHWDIYGCLPIYLGIDKHNIVFRRFFYGKILIFDCGIFWIDGKTFFISFHL